MGHETYDASDEAVVEETRRRPEAFARLYQRHVTGVYRYCFLRLGNREDAEDATSQTFTKALVALPQQNRLRSFKSWLFTIARNVTIDMQRARRPSDSLDGETVLRDPGISPEDAVILADDQAEVRDLLSRLPAGERDVIELRAAGLSGDEIALALGRSRAAVKVAQYRGYSRLRVLMGIAIAGDPLGSPTEVLDGSH